MRFAAIVPYNFSSLEAPTSRQEKKANWQRSSSIFMSQKGSHFIPYQRKCQIHERERKYKKLHIEMKNTDSYTHESSKIKKSVFGL